MLTSEMKRRIAHLAAELQLALVERREVLPAGELNAVVIGIQRLHNRFARLLAASGAPGHLGQQLKRALGGAEIGDAESDVGRDHADQRHPRKVVAFRNHLGADQDVDVAVAESRQERGQRTACGESHRDRAAPHARPDSPASPRPRRVRSRIPPARGTDRRTAGTPSARVPCSCSSGSAPAATGPSP